MDPASLFVSFKSASKIRLVRCWPALLETRASRLPTTGYAGQPIAIGSQAAYCSAVGGANVQRKQVTSGLCSLA